MMNELLKKIYDNILTYENDVIEIKKGIIDEEVQNTLITYRKKLSETELSELQKLLYSASYAAEHAGFEIGVRFMIKILTDL